MIRWITAVLSAVACVAFCCHPYAVEWVHDRLNNAGRFGDKSAVDQKIGVLHEFMLSSENL